MTTEGQVIVFVFVLLMTLLGGVGVFGYYYLKNLPEREMLKHKKNDDYVPKTTDDEKKEQTEGGSL